MFSSNVCVMCADAVYLFFGLVLMLLLVANVYEVPELNLGRYFYARSDEAASEYDERQRLQPAASDGDRAAPPRYTTTDATAVEQDTTGGATTTKRSKKAEDKKRLTDDSL